MPTRTCIGCKRKGDQASFLRVLRADGGRVVLYRGGPISGRSAYVCPRRECVEAALVKHRLDRAIRAQISPEARDELKNELICKLR